MKHSINTYTLLCLVATFLLGNLTSCSDDNFIEESVTTEIIPPDTIGYTFITGKIKDTDGNLLSNIEVEYLTSEGVQTINTNIDGVYEIRELDEDVNRTALRCHGEGFLPKVEVINIYQTQAIENDIILASEAEVNDIPTGQLASLSVTDSLVSISGRIVNNVNEPVSGIIVYIVNVSFTTFLYAITNSDGIYEFASEPVSGAVLLIGNECEGVQSLTGTTDILEDKVFEDLTMDLVKPTTVNYSGFITDCYTGEGLISGAISFQFEGDVKIVSADIINGIYNVNVPQCKDSDCIDVKIYAYQTQSGIDELTCLDYEQGSNTLDYEVCNTQNETENDGVLNFNLNGAENTYQLVEVEKSLNRYTILAANFETQRVFFLQTQDLSVNGQAESLIIADATSGGIYYNSLPNEVSYQIDSTTVEFMYGSFQGTTLNAASGQTENIEGTFKAEFN